MEKITEQISKVMEDINIQHDDCKLVEVISSYFTFLESIKSDHDIMGDEKLLGILKLLRKCLGYINEDCFAVVKQICAKHPKYNIDEFMADYE